VSRVVLSEAARVDRRETTACTVKRFGIAQARRLRDRSRAALNSLAESPSFGRTTEELDPPGRTLCYFVVVTSFIIVWSGLDGHRPNQRAQRTDGARGARTSGTSPRTTAFGSRAFAMALATRPQSSAATRPTTTER
jgi:plasmid stabilization system protein ParE